MNSWSSYIWLLLEISHDMPSTTFELQVLKFLCGRALRFEYRLIRERASSSMRGGLDGIQVATVILDRSFVQVEAS